MKIVCSNVDCSTFLYPVYLLQYISCKIWCLAGSIVLTIPICRNIVFDKWIEKFKAFLTISDPISITLTRWSSYSSSKQRVTIGPISHIPMGWSKVLLNFYSKLLNSVENSLEISSYSFGIVRMHEFYKYDSPAEN